MVVQSSGNTSVLLTESFATKRSNAMLTVAVAAPTLTSFSAPKVSDVLVAVSATGCDAVIGVRMLGSIGQVIFSASHNVGSRLRVATTFST